MSIEVVLDNTFTDYVTETSALRQWEKREFQKENKIHIQNP